jgi:hypothetical protein
LDPKAKNLFVEGRAEYNVLKLREQLTLREHKDTWLFLWDGDYEAITLGLLLQSQGLKLASGGGFALEIEGASAESVLSALQELSQLDWPKDTDLAKLAQPKRMEKHDGLLSDALLEREYAAKMFDIPGARALISRLLSAS